MSTSCLSARVIEVDQKHSLLIKYITKNSEYLIQGGVCLEARRRGPELQRAEGVPRQRVIARVRPSEDGRLQLLTSGNAEVGDCLLLGGSGRELLTSPIARIVTATTNDQGVGR